MSLSQIHAQESIEKKGLLPVVSPVEIIEAKINNNGVKKGSWTIKEEEEEKIRASIFIYLKRT